MGGGEISVRQAVQAVNKFADSLPIEQQSEARAYMTDFVFARKGVGSERRAAPQALQRNDLG